MTNIDENNGTAIEVVGVCRDANALEATVFELEVSGFDRATISALDAVARAKEQIHLQQAVDETLPDFSAPPSQAGTL